MQSIKFKNSLNPFIKATEVFFLPKCYYTFSLLSGKNLAKTSELTYMKISN